MTRNMNLDAALETAVERFLADNPKSVERHQEACRSMPGGNTRSILHYAPVPLTIVRGEGCRLEDLDGHVYTDFLGEYSAGLYGHSNETIRARIEEALASGVAFGGPNRYEAKLAELIVARFPAIDLVRFCNSGSEANLMCLGVARAVTGRNTILGFRGAYHGGFLMLGSGHEELNVPYRIVLADYNDTEGTAELIAAHRDDLAAVILEPMMGASGSIPAEQEFLEMLRRETEACGALLVFDEVITSRLSPGGLQKATGVHPDLTSLGKYLGGGLTFGAFGGRADIMQRFDPSRPDCFFHAGTFNNNVLSMAAGYAGLSEVFTESAAHYINASGEDLRRRLNAVFRCKKLKAQATGRGSIMTIHFTDRPIRRPADIGDGTPELRRLLHLEMLRRNQYMAPRGMMTVSLPMGHREFDGLVHAIGDFVGEHEPLLRDLGLTGDRRDAA